MKYALLLLILLACAQTPEPVFAPPTDVVMTPCEGTRSVGEACTTDCNCLRPATCMQGLCALTRLPLGDTCSSDKQCLSGYCREDGRCGGPDGPNLSYDCARECKDRYDGTPRPCHTVCRERYSEEQTS